MTVLTIGGRHEPAIQLTVNMLTVKLLVSAGSQINAGSLINAKVSRPVF